MDNRRRSFELVAVTVVITAILTFVASTAYFTGHLPFLKPSANEKLEQTLNLLEQTYYLPTDREQMMEGAVRGAVNSLGDPYTTYMDPQEWEEFNTYISGSYSGLGITITAAPEDNSILVVSPFDHSPAAQAGIETGDKIIKVEGEDVYGDKLDDAVAKMKGKDGTSVQITVLKKSGEEQTLTLTRQKIEMETVASELVDGFGYIRISMFDVNTGNEFEQHLQTMLDGGAKGLIIDVRQNGGGVTDAAQQVAESLLPPDCTVYYTSDREGNKQYYKTKKDGIDLPIVMLIDEGTASASEILSAAVKENGRGVLVGQKSFGKGLVQQPFMLSDGSVVKVTIERYFTPNGTDINQQGIAPDHEVELATEADEQLQFAIDLLKNQS